MLHDNHWCGMWIRGRCLGRLVYWAGLSTLLHWVRLWCDSGLHWRARLWLVWHLRVMVQHLTLRSWWAFLSLVPLRHSCCLDRRWVLGILHHSMCTWWLCHIMLWHRGLHLCRGRDWVRLCRHGNLRTGRVWHSRNDLDRFGVRRRLCRIGHGLGLLGVGRWVVRLRHWIGWCPWLLGRKLLVVHDRTRRLHGLWLWLRHLLRRDLLRLSWWHHLVGGKLLRWGLLLRHTLFRHPLYSLWLSRLGTRIWSWRAILYDMRSTRNWLVVNSIGPLNCEHWHIVYDRLGSNWGLCSNSCGILTHFCTLWGLYSRT